MRTAVHVVNGEPLARCLGLQGPLRRGKGYFCSWPNCSVSFSIFRAARWPPTWSFIIRLFKNIFRGH